MIKIGLIGESPYDTDAIINLLSPHYQEHFRFVKLLSRVTGNNLESKGKIERLVNAEIKSKNDIRLVIFMRDLDAPENDKKAMSERSKWFEHLLTIIGIKSIFLLNIYELEALILSDIENFNKLFGVKIKFNGDPMLKPNPKEFLIQQTRSSKRKFAERENPEIFKKLDLHVIKGRCRYFKVFIKFLEEYKN